MLAQSRTAFNLSKVRLTLSSGEAFACFGGALLHDRWTLVSMFCLHHFRGSNVQGE